MFWQRCSWVLLLAGLTQLPGFAQPDPSPTRPAEGTEEAAAKQQRNATSLEQLEIGAEERLLATIEVLPARWSSLPAPKLPYSGRSPDQVLAEAQMEEIESALLKFKIFVMIPLDMRPELRERLFFESEVALWVPGLLVDHLHTISSVQQSVLLEAWLSWVEPTGRQDALLAAASASMDLLLRRWGVRTLEKCTAAWATLPITEEAGAGAAELYNSHGHILVRRGRKQEAIETYRKARSIFEKLGDLHGQGTSWGGEADSLFLLQKNQEALGAYRKMRSLFENLDNPSGQGHSWFGEAEVLVSLGRNLEALEGYRRARLLFLDSAGGQFGQGHTWRGEADVLFRLGQNLDALAAYRKARSLYENSGDRVGQGNTWIGEADILFQLGKHREALDAYKKARLLYEDEGSQLGEGNSWSGEADILLRLEKHKAALDAYRKARSLYENVGDRFGQAGSWKGEASVQMRLLAFAEAEVSARKAIAILNALRKDFHDETGRLRHHDNNSANAYDILVPALVELGSATGAVVAAEEAKSRVLLDLIAGRFPARSQDGEPFDFAQKKLEIQTSLADLEKGNDGESGLSDQEQAAYDRELEQLAFEGLLESKTALIDASPLTFQQLSALIEETGPVLGFYVANAETFGYLLLPKSTPVLFRAPLSWGYWLEKAPAVVDHLANENYKNTAEKDVRELWDQLFLPLAASLPESGTLLIVPHGPLHQLPFETLADSQGRRLFERFELSVVPSLATLAELRKRHRPANQQDRLLALAAGRGLTLPQNEIKAIGRLFNSKEAADFSAKLANFSTYEKLVPRTRHLLVASHGIHVEGNLRQTYLEIEPSTNHDHRLSAAEIATIPIDAELVTLAACDTAVGKADLSDERLDLSRAFLVAGGAAVLATRWRLPDDPRTTQFLVDFYSAYRGIDGQKGKRKDEALNIARRLAIERGDPSAFWAAWVLIGDPR